MHFFSLARVCVACIHKVGQYIAGKEEKKTYFLLLRGKGYRCKFFILRRTGAKKTEQLEILQQNFSVLLPEKDHGCLNMKR